MRRAHACDGEEEELRRLEFRRGARWRPRRESSPALGPGIRVGGVEGWGMGVRTMPARASHRALGEGGVEGQGRKVGGALRQREPRATAGGGRAEKGYQGGRRRWYM